MKNINFKRAMTTVLSATMLLTLVGCTGGEAKKDADTKPTAKVEQEGDSTGGSISDLTVGFAQSGNPNPWMVALTESVEDSATKAGVKYIYTDANNDMATHVANIEDMLAKNLDYLVIAPLEDTGLESVLAKAKEAKVPVILSGRTTTGEWDTTVYSDQAWEGERAAEIIGKHKADAKVVELRGIEGTSSVTGREAGFRKIMAESYPDMSFVAEQTANFSREEGMDVMTNLLQSLGKDNIDAVFCHNDEMALGAIQAIKDAGLTPGKDIVIVGIDGQQEAWDAIKEGEMLATVQCSPKHGPTIFEVIQDMENGGTPEQETIIPDKVITSENLDEAAEWVF